MAGTIAISDPSATGVARFSRNRTSSPSRYMLMKRRSEPDSSQTLARKPGNFESTLSSTSLTVAASTSTVSAPDVNFRSGVGMTTLSDMMYTPKYCLECGEFRFDDLRRRQIQRVECLQAVSSDGKNRDIGLFDAALLHQLLRHGHRDPA